MTSSTITRQTAEDLSARIGVVISNAMARAGVTVDQLADQTRIPLRTLEKRLAGSPITVNELHAIATAIDVYPAELIRIAENHQPLPPVTPCPVAWCSRAGTHKWRWSSGHRRPADRHAVRDHVLVTSGNTEEYRIAAELWEFSDEDSPREVTVTIDTKGNVNLEARAARAFATALTRAMIAAFPSVAAELEPTTGS